MKTSLKSGLEKAIRKWLDKACSEGKVDDYVPDNFARSMANAAEVVFDQNADTQKFLKEDGVLK